MVVGAVAAAGTGGGGCGRGGERVGAGTATGMYGGAEAAGAVVDAFDDAPTTVADLSGLAVKHIWHRSRDAGLMKVHAGQLQDIVAALAMPAPEAAAEERNGVGAAVAPPAAAGAGFGGNALARARARSRSAIHVDARRAAMTSRMRPTTLAATPTPT